MGLRVTSVSLATLLAVEVEYMWSFFVASVEHNQEGVWLVSTWCRPVPKANLVGNDKESQSAWLQGHL